MKPLLALASVLASGTLPACCGVSSALVPVVFRGQTDIVIWDEEMGVEHFVRNARFDSEEDMGFLAPTPSVTAESSRAAMAGHRVVYLKVGLTDAAARVGLGASRPLLLGNVRGTMKALLEERSPVYESVSMAVVDTDGRTPDEVATLVEEALDG